jgi:hypothetical protein
MDLPASSFSRSREELDVVLTDLLEGTTDEIIRNAVVESMNDTSEPFNSSSITSIVLDTNERKALVTFSEVRFAKKFLQLNNLMLFSRLIPIQEPISWNYRDNTTQARKELQFRRTDRKTLETLITPATLQYITDQLKCTIEHDIVVQIRLKGPDQKSVNEAYQLCFARATDQ